MLLGCLLKHGPRKNVKSIIFFLIADEIPKEDTLALLAELADPEDEDGFFPYTPFIDRLCGKA